jgi:hypothetical protein
MNEWLIAIQGVLELIKMAKDVITNIGEDNFKKSMAELHEVATATKQAKTDEERQALAKKWAALFGRLPKRPK